MKNKYNKKQTKCGEIHDQSYINQILYLSI